MSRGWTAVAAAAATILGGVFAPPPRAEARAPERPPVVLLVFDEWPTDAMLTPAGRIDAGRYPNLAALARQATWYPNATTVYDTTSRAVPATLDGQLPRPGSEVPTYLTQPHSIFTILARRGYRVDATEPLTRLCPPSLCPASARPPVEVNRQLRADRRRIQARSFRRIRGARRTFYFRHSLLPHGPYLYLPSGQRVRPGVADPIPGMGAGGGFGERYLTHHKQQRLRLQLGLVDRQVGRLIDRLKRRGRFDDALFVLTADHGISARIGAADRRVVTPENVHEIAPVPLIVKAPRQRRGAVDPALIRTVDVLPEITRLLGIRVRGLAGRSARSPETRGRKQVQVLARNFTATVDVSGVDLAQRRARARRGAARVYGFGTWPSLFSSPGRYSRLVGRSAADLPKAPPAIPAGTIATASSLARVRLRSGVLPVQVAGSIGLGLAGDRRDFVVSVGGRIRAAGRTFRLSARPGEHFAAMVPPSSLKRGANDVRIYEVFDSGERLRLLARTDDAPGK